MLTPRIVLTPRIDCADRNIGMLATPQDVQVLATPIELHTTQDPKASLVDRIVEISVFKTTETILGADRLAIGYGDIIKGNKEFSTEFDTILNDNTSKITHLLFKHCVIPLLRGLLKPTMTNVICQIEKKFKANTDTALKSSEQRMALLTFTAEKVKALLTSQANAETEINYKELAKELINEFFPKPLLNVKEKLRHFIESLEQKIQNIDSSSHNANLLKLSLNFSKVLNQLALNLLLIPFEKGINFIIKGLTQIFAQDLLTSIIENTLIEVKNLIIREKGFDAEIQKMINDAFGGVSNSTDAEAALLPQQTPIAIPDDEKDKIKEILHQTLRTIISDRIPDTIVSYLESLYLPMIYKQYASLLNSQIADTLFDKALYFSKLGIEAVGNTTPSANAEEEINIQNERLRNRITRLIQSNAETSGEAIYEAAASRIEDFTQRARACVVPCAVQAEPVETSWWGDTVASWGRWAGEKVAYAGIEAARVLAYGAATTSSYAAQGAGAVILRNASDITDSVTTPLINLKKNLLNPDQINLIITEALSKLPQALAATR